MIPYIQKLDGGTIFTQASTLEYAVQHWIHYLHFLVFGNLDCDNNALISLHFLQVPCKKLGVMQARKTTAPFSTIDDILRKLCRIVWSVYIQTFTSPARAADVVRDRASTLSSYTLRHQRVLLSRSFGEHAFGFLLNHHCCRYYRLPEVLQPVNRRSYIVLNVLWVLLVSKQLVSIVEHI